jgi:hypothetical protein
MPDTNDHARAETERKRQLFAWADGVVAEIGLAARVAQADLAELKRISLDLDSAEIDLAIRDALHPASGARAEHFTGLREGALKRILESRLNELKRDREATLACEAASVQGSAPQPASRPNPADLVRHAVIERYVELTPHQAVAVTLWILHTHRYDDFTVSPRLALLSPVRGCGKTTLLDVAAQLALRGKKSDSITAAAVYHVVNAEHPTLLVDEADNLDTATDKLLKAVLNAGHRRGAKRMHMVRGELIEFDIFSPMGLATIGLLPMPLMHRSIVIEMKRASRELKRFDMSDTATFLDFLTIRREIEQWASQVILASDPALPRGLLNRPADNWRPLIAIADSVGGEWPQLAREAAMALSRNRPDEDPGVTLLTDIRDIFDRRQIDRLPSAVLVGDLVSNEDGLWGEWRGVKDDQQPRKLAQGELAKLLAPFRIKPRTVWPVPRTKSRSGYYRSQFEVAWAAYCPQAHTPAQPSKIKYLDPHKGNKS